jgi:hypothetical protein
MVKYGRRRAVQVVVRKRGRGGLGRRSDERRVRHGIAGAGHARLTGRAATCSLMERASEDTESRDSAAAEVARWSLVVGVLLAMRLHSPSPGCCPCPPGLRCRASGRPMTTPLLPQPQIMARARRPSGRAGVASLEYSYEYLFAFKRLCCWRKSLIIASTNVVFFGLLIRYQQCQ